MCKWNGFRLFIEESPHYLVTHGKFRRAEKVLIRILRSWNRQNISDMDIRIILRAEAEKRETNSMSIEIGAIAIIEKKTSYTFWHLFCTKTLAIYSVILPITW